MDESPQPTQPTEPPPDEPSQTQVGALDFADAKDRKLLDVAMRRWGIGDRKEKYLKALDTALDGLLERKKFNRIGGIVRVLALLEKQNQDDEHLDHKAGRAPEQIGGPPPAANEPVDDDTAIRDAVQFDLIHELPADLREKFDANPTYYGYVPPDPANGKPDDPSPTPSTGS